MTPHERDLDRAIAKNTRSDHPEVEELAATARRVTAHLEVETPRAERERALFVQAVAARRTRRGLGSFLAPALAGATLIVALGFFAGRALPGDDAYPLRRVMAAVGLIRSPAEEVETRITRAERLVSDAEGYASHFPGRARTRALDAIYHLRTAERLLSEVGVERRVQLTQTITELERRAVVVIGSVLAPHSGPSTDGDSRGPGSRADDEDDDSSGSGSDDDDDDDDNSGPGSDDDDDDDDDDDPGGSDDDSSGSGGDDD